MSSFRRVLVLTDRARSSRIESCILRYERVWGRAFYAGSRLFTVQACYRCGFDGSMFRQP